MSSRAPTSTSLHRWIKGIIKDRWPGRRPANGRFISTDSVLLVLLVVVLLLILLIVVLLLVVAVVVLLIVFVLVGVHFAHLLR